MMKSTMRVGMEHRRPAPRKLIVGAVSGFQVGSKWASALLCLATTPPQGPSMFRLTALTSVLTAGLALAPAAFAQVPGGPGGTTTVPPAPTFTPPIAAVTQDPTPVPTIPTTGG